MRDFYADLASKEPLGQAEADLLHDFALTLEYVLAVRLFKDWLKSHDVSGLPAVAVRAAFFSDNPDRYLPTEIVERLMEGAAPCITSRRN